MNILFIKMATYKFADKVFEIKTTYNYFHKMAANYETRGKADYEIVTNDEMISKWSKENDVDSSLFSNEYIETLLIHSLIADKLIDDDGFIFHGSSIYINNEDNGFIFTAKSGVGKSTHVRLLKQNYKNVNYINDDKPFLRLEDGEVYIYGSPFDGKEKLSNNVKCKLKGIFLLSRSEANDVSQIKSIDAVPKLVEQLHFPNSVKGREKAYNFIFSLSKKIPIYSLHVNMNDDAAYVSYNVMKGL